MLRTSNMEDTYAVEERNRGMDEQLGKTLHEFGLGLQPSGEKREFRGTRIQMSSLIER
jgi:hypothetical protein